MPDQPNERVTLAVMELIAAAENEGSSGQYIVLTTDPQLREQHPHGQLAYGPFPEIEAITYAQNLLGEFSKHGGDLSDVSVTLVPWAQA